MRWLLTIVLSIGLTSCAQQSVPTPDTTTSSTLDSGSVESNLSSDGVEVQAADETESEALVEKAMAMSNVVLTMSDETPTGGELQEPTFLVQADSGHLIESTGIWSLEGTHSTIYREDESDIIIQAGEGVFNQDSMTASLKGDVHLTAGSLIVELADLLWDNEARQATSENPATVSQNSNLLETNSLLIDPDKDQLMLRDVSGMWKLEGLNQ